VGSISTHAPITWKGSRVRKWFGTAKKGSYYFGTIIKTHAVKNYSTGDFETCVFVGYDDGDEEDLTLDDAAPFIWEDEEGDYDEEEEEEAEEEEAEEEEEEGEEEEMVEEEAEEEEEEEEEIMMTQGAPAAAEEEEEEERQAMDSDAETEQVGGGMGQHAMDTDEEQEEEAGPKT